MWLNVGQTQCCTNTQHLTCDELTECLKESVLDDTIMEQELIANDIHWLMDNTPWKQGQ